VPCLVHRAVVLGFPAFAPFPRVMRSSLGDLVQRSVRLSHANGALLLLACHQLLGFSLGALHGFLRNPLILLLPPGMRCFRFRFGAFERLLNGTLVFGFPPLPQLQGIAGGTVACFT
jgi:hypothetical protein